MPRFDLPLSDLRDYRPEVRVPADFDDFWSTTIAGAREAGGAPAVTPVTTPLRGIEAFDVTFPGFAGDPIKAWLVRPRGVDGPLPAVVEFIGYGGGRGAIGEKLTWASAGYAHFVMDTRGQGAGWGTGGATADPHGTGASASGFMTRGIEDPETYYYRRLITDCVLAVDALRGLDRVDASRIGATGGSQGGGLSLAVAGLVPDLAAVAPRWPRARNRSARGASSATTSSSTAIPTPSSPLGASRCAPTGERNSIPYSSYPLTHVLSLHVGVRLRRASR